MPGDGLDGGELGAADAWAAVPAAPVAPLAVTPDRLTPVAALLALLVLVRKPWAAAAAGEPEPGSVPLADRVRSSISLQRQRWYRGSAAA